MPKIEVDDRELFRLLGKSYTEEELVQLLTAAKAEVDDWVREENLLKIELNDTNRPDLWSTRGLVRQLKSILGAEIPVYDFFSNREGNRETGERIVRVDPGLEEIRPYITAFVADGPAMDEPLLIDLIQAQEKLCWNYGRKRSSIAMGIYRGDMLSFPVHFRAADPDKTSFVPLDSSLELTLRQILEQHPKGIEFGSIVADFPLFPYLHDDRGETLSFPPIINSAHLGAVKVGDSHHFIEMTGTDLNTLCLATSIVACDMADAGYRILPVKIIYPYDTPFGRELVTPFYFQKAVTLNVPYASRLLGEEISPETAERCVRRMGSRVSRSEELLTVTPPEYRNDFLHPVDVVEEIMIGRGMDSFEPVWPEEFTIGRISHEEELHRRVRDIMVGLGYQEMIYNYLGSKKDFIKRMNVKGEEIIEIENPMTESYEIVRNSILPNLLSSEAVSANAVYPHRIFEVGKIAVIEPSENYGSQTRNLLGCLIADREAGFNEINSHLSAIFFYLSRAYSLKEVEDPRFISGRAGIIVCDGRDVGLVGEINPLVLENWGITMPCAGAELQLDFLSSELLAERSQSWS